MNKELPGRVATEPQEGRQTKELNFLGFARIPEYIQLNTNLLREGLASFLGKLPYPKTEVWQADIAAGTGLVAQKTIEVLDDVAPQTRLISIGVEPDDFARELAIENTPTTPLHQATFVKGLGQELDLVLPELIPPDGVDLASIHDALHEIREEKDKRRTLELMAKYLKEGGIFTFNSAFTTVGMGKDGQKWGRWKLKAIELLGSTRDKTIPAMTIHKPQDYVDMIIDTGLEVFKKGEITISLTKEALVEISKYPNFIRGVFEDMKNTNNFSLAEKSQALIDALRTLDITQADRIWFEAIARKPALAR